MALGFWAKQAGRYLADERVPSWNNPLAVGKKLVLRYEPHGLVGVIGPWNFPIVNGVRRLHPGADGRQHGDPQAVRGDAR